MPMCRAPADMPRKTLGVVTRSKPDISLAAAALLLSPTLRTDFALALRLLVEGCGGAGNDAGIFCTTGTGGSGPRRWRKETDGRAGGDATPSKTAKSGGSAPMQDAIPIWAGDCESSRLHLDKVP